MEQSFKRVNTGRATIFQLINQITMPPEESSHSKLQNFIASQQWEAARDVAYDMLENQPESSWLHSSISNIFIHLNALTHAEAHLKIAIHHHENHAEAHALLAKTYFLMKRIGSADDCCKKALALDQSNLTAWTIALQIQLNYKNIPAAKECYITLQRLGADEYLLAELHFKIIRHTSNKETIDHQAEIKTRTNLLEKQTSQKTQDTPTKHNLHSQLAYLYQKHTTHSKLAETHLKKALLEDPTLLQNHQTAMLIERKKKTWIRALTAPAIALTNHEELDKKELAIVGILMLILMLTPLFSSSNPWITRFTVFSLIAIIFCSLTAHQAFQYLITSENLHKLGKTSLIKTPFARILNQPYKKRATIIATLTVISWICFASMTYLIIS